MIDVHQATDIPTPRSAQKSVGESYTEQVQLLLSPHMNGAGRLFGGMLVQWIDILAGVVARRHAETDVTTAAIDQMEFKAAAHMGDTIVLCGRITWVGHTSMEVCVDTYIERLDGTHIHINRAYLLMVAVNDEGKPVPVPGLMLLSDDDRAEWAAGEARQTLRRARRTKDKA